MTCANYPNVLESSEVILDHERLLSTLVDPDLSHVDRTTNLAGCAMKSPDRWVAVGAALFVVGGGLAVARLSYMWASGSRFWVMWSAVGVAVAALGLVIMVVGLAMRSSESPPSQIQVGGDRSTNIQAGRDITLSRDDQPRR